jgi:hypothetical protein
MPRAGIGTDSSLGTTTRDCSRRKYGAKMSPEKDLIKRLVEGMVIARATQTAGEASPDQLVLEAVQAFIAKRKGERPANR